MDLVIARRETKIPEMLRMLALFEDERERLDKPQVRHPIRREIVPGRTTDEAFSHFESMAKDRLLAYAQRALDTRDAAQIATRFRATAAQEVFIGTPDQCLAQIAALAAVAPIDPIIVRAQWPDMTADDVVGYLDDLGKEIIPAVRTMVSVPRVVRDRG